MFSINLNEINLDPPIKEDNKIFQDQTEEGAIRLALNYINLNYKDKYDPNILRLKCMDALTHDGIPLEQEFPERTGNTTE